MKVLADTCIWSAVLRHKNPDSTLIEKMKDLINDGRVAIVGPIRQEILSGIHSLKQFNDLKEMLSSFEDIPLEAKHFVTAAEFSNTCRVKGIQGSTIDFLICAVAHLENLIIFTTDKDFENYKKYLSVQLMK